MDFLIKNGDSPLQNVSSPKGTSHSIHNLKLKGLQDDVANHFGIQHAQEHVVRIVLCRGSEGDNSPFSSQGRLGFKHPQNEQQRNKKEEVQGKNRPRKDNTVNSRKWE